MSHRPTYLLIFCLVLLGACERAKPRNSEVRKDLPIESIPVAARTRFERCLSPDGGLETAKEGDVLALALCLEEGGVNPNRKDEDGKTALIWAARYNHIEIAEVLLDQTETDVNSMDLGGMSALMYAVQNNNEAFVRLLLAADADLNVTDREGQSALIIATRKESRDIVYRLLKEGANVDLQDKDGWTALMIAAAHDRFIIAKALLDYKANPFLKNNSSLSTFEIAEGNGSAGTVNILEEFLGEE